MLLIITTGQARKLGLSRMYHHPSSSFTPTVIWEIWRNIYHQALPLEDDRTQRSFRLWIVTLMTLIWIAPAERLHWPLPLLLPQIKMSLEDTTVCNSYSLHTSRSLSDAGDCGRDCVATSGNGRILGKPGPGVPKFWTNKISKHFADMKRIVSFLLNT